MVLLEEEQAKRHIIIQVYMMHFNLSDIVHSEMLLKSPLEEFNFYFSERFAHQWLQLKMHRSVNKIAGKQKGKGDCEVTYCFDGFIISSSSSRFRGLYHNLKNIAWCIKLVTACTRFSVTLQPRS